MKFTKIPLTISQYHHLLLSALMWSGVGIMLIIKSVIFLPSLFRPSTLLLLCVALCLGTLKSCYMLDRIAKKNIIRIQTFQKPTFFAAVYPPATWIAVFVMIGIGVILKSLPLPTILFSFVYCTVGWALLFSSRHAWSAWHRIRYTQ